MASNILFSLQLFVIGNSSNVNRHFAKKITVRGCFCLCTAQVKALGKLKKERKKQGRKEGGSEGGSA